MIPDYWACSCGSYFDRLDLAQGHSLKGHTVLSLEYRDGRDARYRVDQERNTQEEWAA